MTRARPRRPNAASAPSPWATSRRRWRESGTLPTGWCGLKALLDEFSNADGLDPKRRDRLQSDIRDEAQAIGLENDLGLDQATGARPRRSPASTALSVTSRKASSATGCTSMAACQRFRAISTPPPRPMPNGRGCWTHLQASGSNPAPRARPIAGGRMCCPRAATSVHHRPPLGSHAGGLRSGRQAGRRTGAPSPAGRRRLPKAA